MGEAGLLGRLVVPVVAAALAGGLAWAAGVDAGHVVLVVVAVLLVGGVGPVLRSVATVTWPPPAEDSSGTGCHLVPLQARVLHEADADRDRFERVLAPRLRRLATARLHAAHPTGADRTGVRDRLGPQLFDPLRPGHPPRRPVAFVERLLDRLDELDPPPADRPADRPADTRGEEPTG